MLSRGVSHQDTRVLLGKPPPSPGGAGHWCSSRPARISSISLLGHVQVSPPTVGGGPTVWVGVPLPTGVEQELPLVGTAPVLSRARGAHPGPTGGVAAGHACPWD